MTVLEDAFREGLTAAVTHRMCQTCDDRGWLPAEDSLSGGVDKPWTGEWDPSPEGCQLGVGEPIPYWTIWPKTYLPGRLRVTVEIEPQDL
jgi:hypothetical protein